MISKAVNQIALSKHHAVWVPACAGTTEAQVALALPPLQHDLAARLSAFQKRMRALQVGRIDRPKALVERGFQHTLVDEIGDVVEQVVLADHVQCLER